MNLDVPKVVWTEVDTVPVVPVGLGQLDQASKGQWKEVKRLFRNRVTEELRSDPEWVKAVSLATLEVPDDFPHKFAVRVSVGLDVLEPLSCPPKVVLALVA